jgi:hypothetical protein
MDFVEQLRDNENAVTSLDVLVVPFGVFGGILFTETVEVITDITPILLVAKAFGILLDTIIVGGNLALDSCDC